MQGDIEGRLLSYSPATGQTHVLADNIWQANGVALSHDESYVVVVSTVSMRLYRYWLKGGKVPSVPVLKIVPPLLALLVSICSHNRHKHHQDQQYSKGYTCGHCSVACHK